MTRQPRLVLFASSYGQTERIATRIAARLRADGLSVVVADVAGPTVPDPAHYSMVVIGGSLHAGHHQRGLARWMQRHAEAIAVVPSAVFSVSLTAADPSPGAQAEAQARLQALLDGVGVRPDRTATFAGALAFSAYTLPVRWLMRRMARAHGLEGNLAEDVELTDWDAVDRFADRVLDLNVAELVAG